MYNLKSKSELPRKLAGIYEKVLTSLAVKNGVRLLTTLLSAWGKKVVALESSSCGFDSSTTTRRCTTKEERDCCCTMLLQ